MQISTISFTRTLRPRDHVQLGSGFTSTPLVSIVLLSLMRWKQTRNCIISLIEHTPDPYEIIVVDMGSSPEVVQSLQELQQSHSHLRLIQQPNNPGVSVGRNLAAKAATGHHLLFLDNDTEVTSGWLEPLLSVLDSSPDVAAVGCKIVSLTGEVICAPAFVKAEYSKGKLSSVGVEFIGLIDCSEPGVALEQAVSWYPTTCLLVRRGAFQDVGGFDEAFLRCEEDKDLCLRLGLAGYRILYTPETTIIHHNSRPTPEYTRIRNDVRLLLSDITHFERKWKCRPFIRHSRSILQRQGLSDAVVDKVKRFSLVNEIVEDNLELRELILTVTDVCNHRCSMCYYHASLNQKTDHLLLSDYRKIAASIGTLKILWVSGGEPFLRQDLAEVCGAFYDHNPLQHVFIPTNGSQPYQIERTVHALIERMPGVRLTIMFSLEGLRESHDQTHGIKGAFDSVMASIVRLHLLRGRHIRSGKSFGILLNTVVSNRNAQEVPLLMSYVKEYMRVDSHFLSPLRGMPKDAGLSAPEQAVFSKLLAEAQPFFDHYLLRSVGESDKQHEIRARRNRRHQTWLDVLGGGELPNQCQAGRLIGVVEPNGSVRLCEEFPIVGNLRDYNYDFSRLWFSHKADNSRRNVPGCKCTHACFIGASDPR
jgi:GT2 family glycosyltransferase/MoaA/NifB/PqqE/SkfB family radical SAM enzyme